MSRTRTRLVRGVLRHVRRNVLGGMVVLVPLGLTLWVLGWLYRVASGFLLPWVDSLVGSVTDLEKSNVPPRYVDILVSVLSVVALAVLLYVVGAFGRWVGGRRIITIWEKFVLRIPLVRSIYGSAKQVLEAVSVPDKTSSRSVVLVEFPRVGIYAVGFLTAYIEGREGKRFGTVFIPTTPNPTTGFLEIIPAEEIIHLAISTEEAVKIIMSGGIISPERLMSREVAPLPIAKAAEGGAS